MDTRYTEQVNNWLTDSLPGGKHILPHLNDGPFWLVVVEDRSAPNWQVELLLNAFPPLAVDLPMWSEWESKFKRVEVFSVPDFVKDTMTWHQVEEDFYSLGETMVRFEHLPTEADLVASLDQIVGLPLDAVAEQLAAADPAAVLTALKSFNAYDELDDSETAADTLAEHLKAAFA